MTDNNIINIRFREKEINVEEGFNILLSFAQISNGMDKETIEYCEKCFQKFKEQK